MTTRRGKWSDPGVPHKGWALVDSYDAGDINQTCEMCETQPIRYIHIVKHPGYSGTLETGCDCCENLTQDYVNPRLRDNELRRKARWRGAARTPVRQPPPISRRRYANSQLPPGWFIASPGLARTIIGDFEIDLFRNGGLWASRVRCRSSGLEVSWQRSRTLEQVAQDAFDIVAREAAK